MALSGLIRSSMSRAIFTQVLAFYDEGTVNLFANLKMGCMAALPLVDVNPSIFIYTLPRHRAATLPPRRTLTMYAITGITGQVGGALARTLLAANKFVRAVVRRRNGPSAAVRSRWQAWRACML